MNTQTIKDVIASKAFQVTAAAVFSGSISAAVGYKLAERHLGDRYTEMLREEIAEAKRFYAALHKTGDFASPEKVVRNTYIVNTEPSLPDRSEEFAAPDEAAKALLTYQGRPTHTSHDHETQRNVFDDAAKYTDLTNEDIADRDPELPYIISIEEYMDGDDLNHQQVGLTYYADDDVLADERDLPVDDRKRTVGDEALNKFGHGSQDSRIVYVRNERIAVDFEITLHDGNYAEIVHGIAPPEPSRKHRKPKGDDG